MRSSILIGLLFETALISVEALAPRKPIILNSDDVILYGNDRVEVMKRSEYEVLRRQAGTVAGDHHHYQPPIHHPPHQKIEVRNTSHHYQPPIHPSPHKGVDARSKPLHARCSSENIFTLNPVVNFTGPDVLMSSIVKGSGLTNIVAVTQGYSIANGITTGVSANLNIVKDFLSATFSVSYTTTWTSSYTAAYSFYIPPGLFGAAVSNPSTSRHSGYIDIGCIGQSKRDSFTSDTYSSHSYGGLAWVDGIISLCTGTSFPMNRCVGNGTLDG